jgi:prepilin-type N-terminal cleavage/methylation domain-containing protein
MSGESMKKCQRGFSLLELLVVVVVMGLVVTAVYTLYLSTQKTAITSEEVADVQQNLRFALDQIAGDIRMAGFMVPEDTPALATTPASIKGNDLIINTFMPTRRFARLDESGTTDGADSYGIVVASAEMTDSFQVGDRVSIIRPSPYEVLAEGEVDGKSRSDKTISIKPISGGTIDYFVGDVLVSSNVAQVAYRLIPDGGSNVFLLQRQVNADPPADVANKISDIDFEYILGGGDVVAVRIRIEGQTDDSMTGQENYSGIKTRALETVVRLRNR